jgi:hypothetical protein
VILDKYLPQHSSDRRDAFLIDINNSLEKIIENGDEINTENKRFLSLFNQCWRLVIEEQEEEKIKFYRNVLLNTAIPNKIGIERNDLYFKWVQNFTKDHILLLKIIYERGSKELSENSDLFKFALECVPDTPKTYLLTLTQELTDKHILHHGKLFTYMVQNEETDDVNYWMLSDLGEEFISFVLTPESLRD